MLRSTLRENCSQQKLECPSKQPWNVKPVSVTPPSERGRTIIERHFWKCVVCYPRRCLILRSADLPPVRLSSAGDSQKCCRVTMIGTGRLSCSSFFGTMGSLTLSSTWRNLAPREYVSPTKKAAISTISARELSEEFGLVSIL